MKKIIAINAGPRIGYNTDLLIKEAAKGAEAVGAEVEYINLFRLEQYTGCISCFACKLPGTYGKCMCKDGLFDVLEKIRMADGLIIGSPNYLGNLTASFRALYERLVFQSPNYLGNLTASFRALYERLVFQSLTYNLEEPNCNRHLIPVLLITTSNCGEEMYDTLGYTALMDSYKNTLSRFVGPTQIFICGNTLQVKDYSKFNWTMFDPEAKKAHHDATFDEYLRNAFEAGKQLAAD